ncbi:MAG: hypothetical protein QXT45_03550 [Candidatus Bilamarchaeaceae archaeon]
MNDLSRDMLRKVSLLKQDLQRLRSGQLIANRDKNELEENILLAIRMIKRASYAVNAHKLNDAERLLRRAEGAMIYLMDSTIFSWQERINQLRMGVKHEAR